MNFITITGNVGRDAEIRVTPKGESVASFSVADSFVKGGEKMTTWWSCQLWGKRSESLAQYLTKGQQVTVVGQVTEREWKDKDGTPRKSLEVRVTDVALQGGKREEAPQRPSHDAAKARQLPAKGSGFDDMDSEIPW